MFSPIFGLVSSFSWTTLLGVITVGYLLYKFSIRNFDHWKKKNVPYPKPLPFIGNFLEIFTFKTTMSDFLARLYNELDGPYFGIFALNKPYFVVKDPELLKLMLVKDSRYFPDHAMIADEKCDSVASQFLFLSKSPQWKLMRSKVGAVFTVARLKNMLPLINDVGANMKAYLDTNMGKNFIEAKELCAKYATDVIASCAFGLNANCFKYEDAELRVAGRKMFKLDWKTSMRQTTYFFIPGLVKLFRIAFLDPGATNAMREIFWDTLERRKKTQLKRNDLVDIIHQLMEKNSPDDPIKFEGDRVIAVAGQFYSAGFETVSSTISFGLYELCQHPEIQSKLRAEIRAVVAQHKGFTYDAIQDMKYLNMVICETLRKYPPIPFLDRMCIQDYKLPDSDLVIEKDTPVYVPVFGLHRDPKYFPDPEKFDPERFSDENKPNLTPFSYLPFGEGPRICMGERFGFMSTRLGMAHILSEFEVLRCKETPVPIKFDTFSLLLSTTGIPMKFRRAA